MRLKSSIIKQLIKEELQSFLQEYNPSVKVSNKPTSEKTKAAIKGEKTEEPEEPEEPTETPEDDKDPYGEDAPSLDPTKRKIQQCIKAGFTKAECKAKFGSEKAKGSFTREQEHLRKKINQLKKDGKIDKATWSKARKALYKGTGAANAVLQKAGVGGGGGRREQQPRTQQAKQPTRQQRMLAIKLLRALIQLQRHPQFQEILSAVKKAAAGGHPIARMVLDAVNVPYGEQRK